MNHLKPQRIAIVCDWLVAIAGSEKVLAEIIGLYPQADLFAVVDFLSDEARQTLHGKRATTTFIQRLPRARRSYASYLPLMPIAIEQLDLSSYDIVLSSSHAVAKGVLTGPGQLHISYVHSPMRYAWDMQHQYLQEASLMHGFKSVLARMMLHYMRIWDVRTAGGVDHFLANSRYIARRIKKAYGRKSTVLYPPVDLDAFGVVHEKEDFYLVASRLVPYKKIPLIVEAFAGMPNRKLVVIGDGTDFARVVKASAPNISVLGYQPFSVLRDHMQRAKAFVFAAEEDFGIAPIEAQACGTPVIAFGKGGVLETIWGLENEEPTGVFYYEQSVAAIQEAVATFELNAHRLTSTMCRRSAERFSTEAFRHGFVEFVDSAVAQAHAV